MRLNEDWRRILQRSWAIRAVIICGGLSGLLMALPAFMDVIPPAWFAGTAIVLNIAAPIIARVLKQPDLE